MISPTAGSTSSGMLLPPPQHVQQADHADEVVGLVGDGQRAEAVAAQEVDRARDRVVRQHRDHAGRHDVLDAAGTYDHLRPGRAGPAHDHAAPPVTAQSPRPSGTASTSPRATRLRRRRPTPAPPSSSTTATANPCGTGTGSPSGAATSTRKNGSAASGRPRSSSAARASSADVLRHGRGERRVAHGGQHDVEAEPEVRLVARGRGDRPLQEDGEVGRLLHLDQEHPGPGRVRLARGHEDAVAGPHADLVEVRPASSPSPARRPSRRARPGRRPRGTRPTRPGRRRGSPARTRPRSCRSRSAGADARTAGWGGRAPAAAGPRRAA